MTLLTICRHCGRTFQHQRNSGLFCSPRCRQAAHRKRALPDPEIEWWGDTDPLAERVRKTHPDGSKWLSEEELGEKLVDLAYSADGGAPKTGRRYYYLCISHRYIQPDMGASKEAKRERDGAYKRVLRVLKKLRMLDDRLPFYMVLDLSRELTEWQTFRSPREARRHMRDRYQEDRWIGQPFRPILIVEKDTLEPVTKPLAHGWQMPFASSRGYSSVTLQHDVAELLAKWFAQGQRPLVLFISDLDPSGLDLERAWKDILEGFLPEFRAEEHFLRIGLNYEQVEEQDLHHLSIEVKESDSRSENWMDSHQPAGVLPPDGDRCWEVDVLEADVIKTAIDRAIRARLDRSLWEQRAREIERARALL